MFDSETPLILDRIDMLDEGSQLILKIGILRNRKLLDVFECCVWNRICVNKVYPS